MFNTNFLNSASVTMATYTSALATIDDSNSAELPFFERRHIPPFCVALAQVSTCTTIALLQESSTHTPASLLLCPDYSCKIALLRKMTHASSWRRTCSSLDLNHHCFSTERRTQAPASLLLCPDYSLPCAITKKQTSSIRN